MSATSESPVAGSRLEVALVGRANSGKTSLLMHLTGTAQKPVNFAGTSVERVTSVARIGGREVSVVDLPGISSLRALSRDERVALDYLQAADGPDVICAVLDATKLRVELVLLERLCQLGKPVVVALNKVDGAGAEGRPVNAAALAELLQIPVIETDGLRGSGMSWLGEALVAAPERGAARPFTRPLDEVAGLVQSGTARANTWTDRLDSVLIHPVFGLPVLLAVMYGTFQLVFSGADPFIGWIESGQEWVSDLVGGWLADPTLRSFVVDGLVNGVGSVVVFLPQIVLLIALVTVLEASGYMARAAFLLDRALSRVGLTGRSFVPLTTSFACAIPGILAARIIGDERDRIATIVVSPLMSCSARLPVYVVLIGAFFPAAWAGLVLFGLYLLGIVTAAVVATVVRRTLLRGGTSPLLMELPRYQRPSLRVVWGQVRSAARNFMALAGGVIFVSAVLIWALSYFPRPESIAADFEDQRAAVVVTGEARDAEIERIDAEESAAYLEQSYLARAGKFLQPAFAPAGFDWRITVGVLASFPAREIIVPTLGILYSLGDVDPGDYDLDALRPESPDDDGLRARLRAAKNPDGTSAFDAVIALAVMVFFALCSQCAATLGAIRRETRSWRWPVFTFVYMTAFAWVAAVAVYQLGRAIGLGGGAG